MFGIKRWIIVPLILICLSLVVSGCSSRNSTPPAPSSPTTSQTGSNTPATVINQVIDTQTAYNMIQNEKSNPDFSIIDVRTPEEFGSGHVAGATNIDIYAQDFQTKINQMDRNKKYLVYCRSGNRSAQAVKIMKDLGFREVYDMTGGITQWVAKGYPTVTN